MGRAAAIKRRSDLAAASVTRGPVLAFRGAMDLAQVVSSVKVPCEATVEVTSHRATLPA